MEAYRTFLPHDKRGAFCCENVANRRTRLDHAPAICAEFQLLADVPPGREDCVPAPPATRARAEANPRENPRAARPSAAGADPVWARASGRAGQGEPLFAAGAGPALLDAAVRAEPPAAGALRARLALQSAAKLRRKGANSGSKVL